MSLLAKLAAAAGLAALTLTMLPTGAEAQHHGQHRAQSHDWYQYGRGNRWTGPEGYFVVYAAACPDLREDRRGARGHQGRRDRFEDRRDRQVLDCPPRAWEYVPSRREAVAGRTGDRLRPDVAYWDHRSNRYYAQTRWGAVPVHVEYGGRGYGHDRRSYQGHSGVRFEFRF
ncbi:hypothetical protein ACWCOP_11560 [Maricaulaceae bacterium MS644]